jgi:hypothetical protein
LGKFTATDTHGPFLQCPNRYDHPTRKRLPVGTAITLDCCVVEWLNRNPVRYRSRMACMDVAGRLGTPGGSPKRWLRWRRWGSRFCLIATIGCNPSDPTCRDDGNRRHTTCNTDCRRASRDGCYRSEGNSRAES